MHRRLSIPAKAMACFMAAVVTFGALNALLVHDLPPGDAFDARTGNARMLRASDIDTLGFLEADESDWETDAKYMAVSDEESAQVRWTNVPHSQFYTLVFTLFAGKPLLSFPLELCVAKTCVQDHLDFGWKGDKVCFRVPGEAARSGGFNFSLRAAEPADLPPKRLAERSTKAEFYSPISITHAVRPLLFLELETCPQDTRAPFRPWKPSFDSFVRAFTNSTRSTERSRKLLVGMVPPKSAGYSLSLLEFQKIPWHHELTLTLFLEERSDDFAPTTKLVLCRWWMAKDVRKTFRSLKKTLRDCHALENPIVQQNTVTFISIPPEYVNDERVLRVAIGIAEAGSLDDFQTRGLEGLLRNAPKDFLTFYSSDAERASHRPVLAVGRDLLRPAAERESNRDLKSPGGSRNLLVVSTCNEVDSTLETLRSFERVSDDFDVIVVDDHSEDETATQVKKLGYQIIEKPKPQGLTHSWNLAYKLALESGAYDNIIFSNNDVLVPEGAISALIDALETNPFVVPMTSRLGAGHNPEQSFDRACNLREEVDQAVSLHWNVDRIQKALPIVCQMGPTTFSPPSVKFGGFFFAVRLGVIKSVEFNDGVLFDPKNVLFGQETALAKALDAAKLNTAISRRAFVFHFKSRTVGRTGYKVGHLEEKHSELKNYHPESLNRTFLADLSASGREATSLREGGVVTVAIVFDDIPTTAESLARQLRSTLKWNAKASPVESLDVSGVDILISTTPLLNPWHVEGHAKPGLVLVAWTRSSPSLWSRLANPFLVGYDLVLTGKGSKTDKFRLTQPFPYQCVHRCPDVALDADGVTIPVEGFESASGRSLREVLDRYGLLPPADGYTKCHAVEKPNQLCIVVRTYSRQLANLDKLLMTFLGHDVPTVSVRAFLVNTDSRQTVGPKAFTARLKALIGVINKEIGYCGAHMLEFPDPDRSSFGYDASDWALQLLLRGGGCDFIMFTNGDNWYSEALVPTIEPYFNTAAFVAWDFHTHHKREKDRNLISVKLKRKFIDLGAFVVRTDVIKLCSAQFLPLGPFTGELFARDWFFVEQIQRCLEESNRGQEVVLVHEALLQHK